MSVLYPSGGIQPIFMGFIWRWLVSRVAKEGVNKDMEQYFNEFQFGVGVSGGV